MFQIGPSISERNFPSRFRRLRKRRKWLKTLMFVTRWMNQMLKMNISNLSHRRQRLSYVEHCENIFETVFILIAKRMWNTHFCQGLQRWNPDEQRNSFLNQTYFIQRFNETGQCVGFHPCARCIGNRCRRCHQWISNTR